MPKRPPTKTEKAHHQRVRDMGCLVCGAPSTLHHVTADSFVMGRLARREDRVVPLCPQHHQAVFDKASDPQSVEMLGHRGFYRKHRIDLLGEAERLWRESNA